MKLEIMEWKGKEKKGNRNKIEKYKIMYEKVNYWNAIELSEVQWKELKLN